METASRRSPCCAMRCTIPTFSLQQVRGCTQGAWRNLNAISRAGAMRSPRSGAARVCEAGEPASPRHDLVAAAIRVDAWGLAKRILRRTMRVHGQHAAALAQLAWCEIRTGRLALAQRLVVQAMALDPQDVYANEVFRRLDLKLSGHGGDWRRLLAHPTLPLSLEPLDPEHATALHRQFRDPQISVMTGLPELSTLDAVRAWIERPEAGPHRREYAVMHRDAGRVGYVSLELSGTTASLCFWTGIDHQGQGFATEAARMVCRRALARGVPNGFWPPHSTTTIAPSGHWSEPASSGSPCVQPVPTILAPSCALAPLTLRGPMPRAHSLTTCTGNNPTSHSSAARMPASTRQKEQHEDSGSAPRRRLQGALRRNGEGVAPQGAGTPQRETQGVGRPAPAAGSDAGVAHAAATPSSPPFRWNIAPFEPHAHDLPEKRGGRVAASARTSCGRLRQHPHGAKLETSTGAFLRSAA